MSTSTPQWIVIDDTATDLIQYSGPWFTDTSGSRDAFGNFGPAFQETLHGANSNASLSFAFTGSHVRLFGSNNLRNDSGVLDPIWECFVDGVSIGATTPFQFAENNWAFCDSQSKISDGSHVLTVNATVAKSQTFWVDQIQYVPSASVPVDNLTILVDSSDPQLAGGYGVGWVALGATANMTGRPESLFTFDFIGVYLSWYGFIPNGLPIAAANSTYAIDGQTPNNFLLKGLSSKNSNTLYDQKFFQTPTLSAGKHQIVVTFQGSGTTTPLTLDYLVIHSASALSTVASAATTTSASATPSTSTASGSSNGGPSPGKSNIGAITGGVVGGAVLLVILAYLFIRCRNRELRSRLIDKDMDVSVVPRPFVDALVSLTETTRRQSKGGGQAARAQNRRGPAVYALAVAWPLQALVIPPRSHLAPQAPTSTLPSLGDLVVLRYVHHADSGIRLSSAAETERIVEVPPEYTHS